jgi:hypothetical protein
MCRDTPPPALLPTYPSYQHPAALSPSTARTVFLAISRASNSTDDVVYTLPMIFFRRLLAGVAALGLAATACIFFWSFLGGSMDKLGMWFVWLHLGAFLLILSMFAVESRAIRNRTFFWKEFGAVRPGWIVPAIKVLGLIFAINFTVFLVAAHGASPAIKDGAYVLNNHGQIIQTLTQMEYARLKGAELRLFASAWVFFYFVVLTYWWFPRRPARAASER